MMTDRKQLDDQTLRSDLEQYFALTTTTDLPRSVQAVNAASVQEQTRSWWRTGIAGGMTLAVAAGLVAVTIGTHHPTGVTVPASSPTPGLRSPEPSVSASATPSPSAQPSLVPVPVAPSTARPIPTAIPLREFVSNGGFEQVQNCTAMGCDAVGWTSSGYIPHPITDFNGSHSGRYAVFLEVVDHPPGPTPSTASVIQQITLPATSKQLTLTYFGATTNWQLQQQGHARAVIIADGVRHVLVDDSLNATPGQMGAYPVFTLRQADVSAYRGKTVTLMFEASLPAVIPSAGGSSGEFHVDDVSLTG